MLHTGEEENLGLDAGETDFGRTGG